MKEHSSNKKPWAPDFICVGVQKGGTTWLYHQLERHPQIYLTVVKELNYYIGEETNGWYQQQFAQASPSAITGDISPNYFPAPGMAKKPADEAPGAKLIFTVRDPVERAFS